MTSVNDIFRFIDETAPFERQESWDNSGLLVGDLTRQVKKIAVVLDVNADTANQAIEKGVDLIVSHHPIIFKPKKNFTADSLEYRLAVNNVSVISAHTCFDSADGGVNDVLCEILGLKNVYVLETADTFCPIVRVGETDGMTGEELAKKIACVLGGKVTLADSGKTIRTLAVCTGSGGDFAAEIAEKQIDAYLTGEASYHTVCDAKDMGLTVICAGHFETEKPAMKSLENRIKERFADVGIVEIDETCPFKYF